MNGGRSPSDPARLIVLSLGAGYGGKAILDALEAKVKTALAEEETDKAKEEGKRAVEAGLKAISNDQKLSRINKEWVNALMKVTQQPREIILETLKTPLPTDLHSFVSKSLKAGADELKQLSSKLDFLSESFQKQTI